MTVLNEFFQVHCIRRLPREVIWATARRLASENFRYGQYNLFQQNCQHFASYCVLGIEWMSDKEPLQGVGVSLIYTLAGVAGIAYFTQNRG